MDANNPFADAFPLNNEAIAFLNLGNKNEDGVFEVIRCEAPYSYESCKHKFQGFNNGATEPKVTNFEIQLMFNDCENWLFIQTFPESYNQDGRVYPLADMYDYRGDYRTMGREGEFGTPGKTIKMEYFTNPTDVNNAINQVRAIYLLFDHPDMVERWGSYVNGKKVNVFHYLTPDFMTDDAVTKAYIDSVVAPGIHNAGGAFVSSTPDTGVVDPELRVWGTTNVRVADVSIMRHSIMGHSHGWAETIAGIAYQFIERKLAGNDVLYPLTSTFTEHMHDFHNWLIAETTSDPRPLSDGYVCQSGEYCIDWKFFGVERGGSHLHLKLPLDMKLALKYGSAGIQLERVNGMPYQSVDEILAVNAADFVGQIASYLPFTYMTGSLGKGIVHKLTLDAGLYIFVNSLSVAGRPYSQGGMALVVEVGNFAEPVFGVATP